ncbi:hypothetical protein [Nocardia wallacei]|uniref:hypothetical protein n=1 Tax=Nocardia TaxID=1817 RepID=UPI0024561C46|nr:hypothetical protein [Nocardia wallacei]
MSAEPHDAGRYGRPRPGVRRAADAAHDATVRAGFESALSVVRAAEAAGVTTLDWFEYAAVHCRHSGVALDAVHRAVAGGIADGLDDNDVLGGGPERADASLATLQELLTTTVDRIYRG